ncbi:hypothetical protein EGW07_24520 [Citrobacter amalonaticus]|nr:hypothetical protein EGW07_24520 [Citrobacter amalonaticus]
MNRNRKIANPLSQLALNAWYKVLIALGSFVFLLAGAGCFQLIRLGQQALWPRCVAVGIGEWINHPLTTAIYQENVFRERVFTFRMRTVKPAGLFFDLLGAVLLWLGALNSSNFHPVSVTVEFSRSIFTDPVSVGLTLKKLVIHTLPILFHLVVTFHP